MSRAKAIIEKIFFDRYTRGDKEIAFEREDLYKVCEKYGIEPLKNMGDGAVYAFRYRTRLPESILATQPEGMEWIIVGAGISRYKFRLVRISRIIPNPDLVTIKIPDATPEIISAYALSDEQALLAKVRYNRLIDIFFGLTAYSLQNHLQTTVSNVGQIEIDEIYVGIDRNGRQYVLPVQAKGGRDRLGTVQTRQDVACCAEKYPNLICRSVSTQFMAADLIAMFELSINDDEIQIVDEKHYRLVPADQISDDDLRTYLHR